MKKHSQALPPVLFPQGRKTAALGHKVLILISNPKATKTGDKQALSFLYPAFGSAKATHVGNCLLLRIRPDVLPTSFG
jgi:hypothetical protein